MCFKRFAAAAACIVAVAGAGCSQQTVNSAQQDAQHNLKVVDQQAKKLADEAKPQVDKLDLGARVSAALTSNANLRGAHIRVDASTTGVRLKGTVKSPEQKTLAGHVAKETLPAGKTVDNQLTVG